MADELIIEGLRVSLNGDDGPGPAWPGSIVVDAIVETDFTVAVQSTTGSSHAEICLEIERLAGGGTASSLEDATIQVIDGLLDAFPQIEGVELTVRVLDPELPHLQAAAIGVRRRRRRPRHDQRLRRRIVDPLPRPR